MKNRLLIAAALWMFAVDANALVLGSKELVPCHLPSYRQEVLCGSHVVFEDRLAAEGREIEIRFAVIPAVGETAAPDPVVLFAGGPGQAAMEMAPFLAQVFSVVNEKRSLVLIDQRGMGSSHPLDCDLPEDDLTLGLQEQESMAREAVKECLEEWDADVSLYTQDLANEDIHEILLALGYEKANLYGGSWGTRSALLFAHRFPEQTRTLVLDGALPLENTAPLYAAADADRALRTLFADCAADPACGSAFPALEDTFYQAIEVLGDGEVSISIQDPSTGEPETIMMSGAVFGGLLRSILYLPELSRIIPIIILQASAGRYDALIGASGFLMAATADSMTLGASLTIFCSEELARVDVDDSELGRDSLVGHAFLESLQNMCSVWPKAPLPSIYSEDVSSPSPALILSGAIDPITPPRWGEAISRALPNSLHWVAVNTGHNVAPNGCAPDLIEQFIEQGNLEGLDGGCLDEIKRPSFFVDASGPAVSLHHD